MLSEKLRQIIDQVAERKGFVISHIVIRTGTLIFRNPQTSYTARIKEDDAFIANENGSEALREYLDREFDKRRHS